MFTQEHLSAMADLFNGLRNILELAPPEHLEAIALLLDQYHNHACWERLGTDDGLPALMIEVGALYGAAAESADRKPDAYRAMLNGDSGEHRRSLAMLAATWALGLTDDEVMIAYSALVDARHKFPGQKIEKAEPKPVAVEKPKKRRGSGAAAAARAR